MLIIKLLINICKLPCNVISTNLIIYPNTDVVIFTSGFLHLLKDVGNAVAENTLDKLVILHSVISPPESSDCILELPPGEEHDVIERTRVRLSS